MKKTEILEFSALVVTYSVVVSIVYDFFFFIGLGINLSMTPIGPVDFLRGWMEWTSKGMFYFIGLMIHFIVRRIESWKTEEELIKSTSNPEQMKKIREMPLKLIFWIAAALFSVYLIFGEVVYSVAILGIIVAGSFFISWFLSGTTFSETVLHPKWSSLWSVLIFCGVFGFHQGAEVMYQSPESLPLNTSSTSTDGLPVIRLFDQWSLVRLNEKELGWYFHQSDRLIKFTPERRQFIGAYCFYWQQTENSKPGYCNYYRHLAPPKIQGKDDKPTSVEL